MNEKFSMAKVTTPIGRLWLVTQGESVWGAELEPRWIPLTLRLAKKGCAVEPGCVRRTKGSPTLALAAQAVTDYFAGDLQALEKVSLALEGSRTRLAVWRRVRRVRPGKTLTYRALAASVGMSGAFRAIGAANGANPCALFVPDHRIISSDGGLRGYGAGVEAKAWLLAHEGVAR